MTEPVEAVSRIYILAIDHKKQHLLVEMQDEGWSLPYFDLPVQHWAAGVASLRAPLQKRLGLVQPWPIVCCAAIWEDATHFSRCYIVECTDQAWMTPASRLQWTTLHDLEQLPPNENTQLSVIRTYFSGTDLEKRSAWERPGWFAQSSSWIEEQLQPLGYHILEIEQVKLWGISCILRIHTTTELLYFKASMFSVPTTQNNTPAFLFTNEALLTRQLTQLFPAHTALPVAINEEQNWMILKDFGPTLQDQQSLPILIQAGETLAEMQIATSTHTEQFLALGCKDRRLNILQEDFENLLSDRQALAALLTDEVTHLQSYIPLVRDLIARLASFHIPYTLVHGDLDLWNLAYKQGQIILFDWSDGCIAHPFFDIFFIISNSKQLFPDRPEAATQVRTAYLARWSAYETLEHLEEALAIATMLTPVHLMISYQRLYLHSAPVWQPLWRDFLARLVRDLFAGIEEWQRQKGTA